MTIPSFEELLRGQETPTGPRVQSRLNTFDIPSFDELGQEDSFREMTIRIGNRTRNIGRLMAEAIGIAAGKPPNMDLLKPIFDARKREEEIEYTINRDLENVFAQADLSESLKSLWEGTKIGRAHV